MRGRTIAGQRREHVFDDLVGACLLNVMPHGAQEGDLLLNAIKPLLLLLCVSQRHEDGLSY